MSVSDQTALIFAGIILNYITVYKRNRLLGNIVYLLIGIFTFIAPGTHAAISLIILGTAIIGLVYDLAISSGLWENSKTR